MPPLPPAASQAIESLRCMPGVRGVALTGSWATGCAAEGSDVDLLVLCGENRFEASHEQGILIEISCTTYERALEKLCKSPMEPYRWLEAKILFDDDGLAELIRAARDAYESYRTPAGERCRLAHWLRSLELKLSSAGNDANALCAGHMKERYLAATNAWILLEAVWAANNRPMPPTATAYRLYPQLGQVLFPGWFEALFHEDNAKRLEATRQIIAWALERLEK